MNGVFIDQKLPLLAVGLNLGVLVLLPLFLRSLVGDSRLMFLSLGCFLGHLAFLSAWSVWNHRGWFQRIVQTNLLFVIGWCVLTAGQILPASDFRSCLGLLGFGAFYLVFMHTLLDSLSRRRWQFTLRAAFWWTTVFALVAAISQFSWQSQSPPDTMDLFRLCFRFGLMSGLAGFVAVLTLVVYSLKRRVPDKALRLALICVLGATLLVVVLGGISIVTGDNVGRFTEIFMQWLLLNVGIVGMLVSSLALYARRGVSWGPMPGAVTFARGVR